MAYIVFLAKGRDVGSCRLAGPTTLGRSLDCDLFVPDVFVSRQHCRFEQTPQGWVVEDLGSRNGLYFRGRPVRRRVLHHNDTIELGTIGFQFDEGELPANMSSPAPLGTGSPVAELVETLFTDGMRPSEFTKRRKRKPAWARRHHGDAVSLDLVELETVPEDPPPVYYDEWTELDVEIGTAAAAEGDAQLVAIALRPLAQDLLDRARAGDQEAVNAILDQITATAPVVGVAPAPIGEGVRQPDRQAGRGRGGMGAANGGAFDDLAALLPPPDADNGDGANGNGANGSSGTSGRASMFSSHRSLWDQVSDGADEEKDAAADRKSRRDTEKGKRANGRAHKNNSAVSGSALVATGPTIGDRLAQLRETIADGYSPDAIVYKFRERPVLSSLVATAAAVLFGGTVWFINHRSMPPKFDASGQMHHSYIPGPEN